METSTPTPTPTPTLDIDALGACALWTRADPDHGAVVRLRAAWRDLGSSGSGPEVYRQFRYPGRSAFEWPDADRLPPPGGSAATRCVTVTAHDVPAGTLVLQYSRDVYRGHRGKCSRRYGLLGRKADGGSVIFWLEHRVLRARPVDEIALPDGTTLEVPRRES